MEKARAPGLTWRSGKPDLARQSRPAIKAGFKPHLGEPALLSLNDEAALVARCHRLTAEMRTSG